jgi:ABC-type maltose transport system permease subunit
VPGEVERTRVSDGRGDLGHGAAAGDEQLRRAGHAETLDVLSDLEAGDRPESSEEVRWAEPGHPGQHRDADRSREGLAEVRLDPADRFSPVERPWRSAASSASRCPGRLAAEVSPFGSWFVTTVIVAVVSTVLAAFVCSLAGFGFTT